MLHWNGLRLRLAVTLAVWNASCGVFAPEGDCTLRANCPAESDAGIPSDDAADMGSDAVSSPDVTADAIITDAVVDAFDGASFSDAQGECIPTGPEVCTNGVDDDCNGSTDCADPVCHGFLCASAAPVGWLGPVVFWLGAAGYPVPDCPPGFLLAFDGHGGLNAAETSCSCTCTASGQQCEAKGAFYGAQLCGGVPCATVVPSSAGACTELASNNCGASGSFNLTGPTVSGGTCAAQMTSTIPPAQWSTSARLCAYVGPANVPGGCAAGDRCLPAPPSPFNASPCIYSMGDSPSCPAGYDGGARVVIYSGFSDTRSCSECNCSGPSGGSCSGTVALYGASGCTDSPDSVSYAIGTTCKAYSALSPSPGSVRAHYVVNPGTCGVQSAPAPTGQLTTTGSVTVCCK